MSSSPSSMKVSQWTSSYNAQYRDSNNVISPNAGEPMHHFAGFYDQSHYQRDPGFYGSRATLAATAKLSATQAGQSARLPVRGEGSVGYGAAPAKQRAATASFYAPPAEPSTQQYSALRQTGLTTLSTQRVGGSAVVGSGSASARFGATQTAAPYGDKELWTHPIVPHGVDPRTYGEYRGQPLASTASFGGQQSARFGASQSFSASSASSSAEQGGLVDSAFVDAPDEWRYDDRGVAMAKGVELRRNTDPRRKYHIPGYSGFVRGKNFEHGHTFAKTTRNCLDVPLDLPTDI